MCVGAGNYVRVGEWVLGVCEIIKCVCVVCVGGGGGWGGRYVYDSECSMYEQVSVCTYVCEHKDIPLIGHLAVPTHTIRVTDNFGQPSARGCIFLRTTFLRKKR